MKILFISISVLFLPLFNACSSRITDTENYNNYRGFSRFTDPKDLASMLDKLPEDVIEICEIAKQQTVHHNLLPYFGVPKSDWKGMTNPWPSKAPFPGVRNMLAALKETKPHNIYNPRPVENRLIGACMLESAFLACLLRHQSIPARIRAGYFKNIMGDSEHVISFWENVSRAKGIQKELLEKDPTEWKQVMNNVTRKQQVEVDKHIEHWICEYWDKEENRWRLLDANNTFLKASSNIDVGYQLQGKYFEFAFQSWKKMRSSESFNQAQYAEWPQDGRSHIRSQMLCDFYNLLNHDMVGYDDQTSEIYNFIKGKKYEDTPPEELQELDELAELLAQNPTKDDLVNFYNKSKTLQLESAETDPYSFVFRR